MHDRAVVVGTIGDVDQAGGTRSRHWIAALALMACCVATTPRFLFDHAPSIQRMSAPWALALTTWWLLPLSLFLLAARSTLALVVGGTGYVAAAAYLLAATYRNEHSTAGFGIVFTPIYLSFALLALIGLERLARSLGP